MPKRHEQIIDSEFDTEQLLDSPIYNGLVDESVDPETTVAWDETKLPKNWKPSPKQVQEFDKIYQSRSQDTLPTGFLFFPEEQEEAS